MLKKINRVRKLTESDREEFESLVKANMKRAYFTALGITGSHDTAMEISQEAFLRVYKNFHKYDRSKKFFTWYYKILKNLYLNFLRNKKKDESRFLEYKYVRTESDDPIEQVEAEELKSKLEESLLELEPGEREIITLKEFEDLSYKEISEMLGIPQGTVMSRLFYARKKLSVKLKRKL